MITATQSMLNNTMNSEFSEWMPNADEMKTNMDRFLKNSHEQGRNLIASRVTDFMPQDSSQEERDNLVNQILEIWDKLYDTVLASLAEKPKVTDFMPQDSSQEERDNLVNQILEIWDKLYDTVLASLAEKPKVSTNNSSYQKAEDDSSKSSDPANLMDTVGSTVNHVSGMFHMSAAVEFVQQNLGMFMSVLESVFTVMKSNMTLILTVITFVFSTILGGGTAILNFVLASIIFLTALFYLLSSSGDVYKPVEIFKSIPGSTGSSFATAVEQAISGVFTASLKMAAFYGLYTWLVHLVFGMEIVFIPSALAAVFAAMPFLGPYWAALPAVIELWLVQGRGLCALTLLLAHMLPAGVVDAKIYGEIEGGHPYVTGLAIAGGIMFMGLQGAIIGPIILCFFIVVFKMYGSLLDSEQVPATPQREDDQSRGILFKRHQSII
ncbi:transmembrane protein 245-like [Elysia marginata]|uniref:Transmembrane protein 245-like n=1 Tax=Elysia marginata TaxID=1093978 RepID=A0AAV4JTM3_9GAST|nr:transmembrane protein 245-like [Elysia marginata]